LIGWPTSGLVAGLLLAGSAQAQDAARSPAGIAAKDLKELASWLPGTWTNEEQVYFTQETDPAAKPVPWARLDIAQTADGQFTFSRFGGPLETVALSSESVTLKVLEPGKGIEIASSTGCTVRAVRTGGQFTVVERSKACNRGSVPLRALSASALYFGAGEAVATELRKARDFVCWIAAPKVAKKADGSTDWFGAYGVKLHDQGGRAWVETDEPQPQKFGLKLRNVVWPYGNNRSALTLYLYKADAPDKAAAYSWADPGAVRVGLNVRWMQASCTLSGAESR
jgi:hypothetical protein